MHIHIFRAGIKGPVYRCCKHFCAGCAHTSARERTATISARKQSTHDARGDTINALDLFSHAYEKHHSVHGPALLPCPYRLAHTSGLSKTPRHYTNNKHPDIYVVHLRTQRFGKHVGFVERRQHTAYRAPVSLCVYGFTLPSTGACRISTGR